MHTTKYQVEVKRAGASISKYQVEVKRTGASIRCKYGWKHSRKEDGQYGIAPNRGPNLAEHERAPFPDVLTLTCPQTFDPDLVPEPVA
jgi:hypothetical protein